MVAAFLWLSHPDVTSLAVGLPLSACGLTLRAWAAGHLAKDQRLATSGPYAFTRNPLYLGTLLAALGLAVAGRSPALALLFTALFALVYLPAIELEEQHLTAILPGYSQFAARVPLLFHAGHRNSGRTVFPRALQKEPGIPGACGLGDRGSLADRPGFHPVGSGSVELRWHTSTTFDSDA